jgi:hypothetical protein
MKLNLVRDYQTGVYDYNDMLSVFSALAEVDGRSYGLPTKVSFSCQEWCGHVYSQLLFGPRSAHQVSHSYFDGEADSTRDIKFEPNTGSEDALALWARGIGWPYTPPGGSNPASLVSSLEVSRAKHAPVRVIGAALSREAGTQRVTVPAGAFTVQMRTAKLRDGSWRKYYVEAAPPHRLCKWEASDGERAELLGSERMKYWEMNREGGEQALGRMGLSRRGLRMP